MKRTLLGYTVQCSLHSEEHQHLDSRGTMVNKEKDKKSKKNKLKKKKVIESVPIIVVFSGFQTRICIFSINSISNNN